LNTRIYTSLSYLFYFASYVGMLFILYNDYKGGSDFETSDLPEIFIYLLAPPVIAAFIAILVRLFKPLLALRVFYLSITYLSIIGGGINSLAAYLAWYSTTH
jgi:hypothetical protein